MDMYNIQQTLTRKWNAKRHCNTKHGGTIDSIVLFHDYLLRTSSIDINNNNIYRRNIVVNDTSIDSLRSLQQHLSSHQPGLRQESDYTEELHNGIIFYDTLKQLAPKHEELENTISYFPEDVKKSYLGMAVIRALFTENQLHL